MRTVATILATLTLSMLSNPASAQSTWVEISDSVSVPPFALAADALEDMDVVNAGGTKVGEIEEVVGPAANQPTALVVDFEDDAGYGSSDVVVPLAGFTLQGEALLITADPATVKGYEILND